MKKEIYIFIFAFLFASFVFLLHFYIVKSAVWGDGQYYYSYLRSAVIDRDLNFKNELEYFLREIKLTRTGMVANKYSIGPAILWAPFFLIAHFLSRGDGYSYLYQAFIGFGSCFYSVLGLWLCFLTVKKYFNKNIALFSSLGLWLSSNLFFYTAVDPINSHSISFFVSSLVVYFLSNTTQYIILGFLTGFLTLIRNQDVIFVLPVLFAIGLNFYFLLFSFSFLLTFLPQLFVWQYLYGRWQNPYMIGEERFYWFAPKIFSVLFSQNNGLFYYSPILILALIGLYYFYKKNKKLAFAGFLLFTIQTYIISSWHNWYGGQAFGGRMFISLMPFFIIGLAGFLNKLKLKYSYKVLFTFIAVFIVLNFGSIMTYLLSKP